MGYHDISVDGDGQNIEHWEISRYIEERKRDIHKYKKEKMRYININSQR